MLLWMRDTECMLAHRLFRPDQPNRHKSTGIYKSMNRRSNISESNHCVGFADCITSPSRYTQRVGTQYSYYTSTSLTHSVHLRIFEALRRVALRCIAWHHAASQSTASVLIYSLRPA
mmetsp:Transcript_21333/g.59290  ORF Transcript_21333/g.59290 Transcript_21333/m.59290 type:complete len:117 (-) Transcript_21333:1536-1886(-)